MEDASLDEFVSGGDEDSDAGPEDAAADDGEDDGNGARPAQAATADDVEPATPTSRWEPDGAACDACGETVRRRWQSADGYVCRSCKDW